MTWPAEGKPKVVTIEAGPVGGSYYEGIGGGATLVQTTNGNALVTYDATWRHFLPRQYGYEGPVPQDMAELTPDHFRLLSDFFPRLLPLIGALYTAFTVQSAIDVWRGKGGMWKGRSQALAASS